MSKPWLLWTHDPCYEGGWHISGEFDTEEEATQAAKEQHERELKCLEDIRKESPDYVGCYDVTMVTPGAVFTLEAPGRMIRP